jgi:hypothetical protein
MHAAATPLLFGPYATPPVRAGDTVIDEARGAVRVVGLSSAPIPWPLCDAGRARAVPVLCGALADAVRREAALAVARWWGVSHAAVRRWRRALGVGATTEGTSRLKAAAASRPRSLATPARGREEAKPPEAGAKSSAAKRGRPWGTPQSAEARAKISATHRRLGIRPPTGGPPWTPEQDALLHLPAEEVAARTGRSVMAVRVRRAKLKRRGAADTTAPVS